MSNQITPPEAGVLTSLVAVDIVNVAHSKSIVSSGNVPSGPLQVQLADAINEVQYQTQKLGASLLHLSITDPYWVIKRSGLITPDTDGLLPAVIVEFPKGSNLWWQSVMVDFGEDYTQPDLTWTFQDLIVAELSSFATSATAGPLGVAPHTQTRAQFFKQLVDRCNSSPLTLQKINFICWEIDQVQPVQPQPNSLGQLAVLNAIQAQNKNTKTNKGKGLGVGAQVTIKGQAPTKPQIDILNTAISLADQFGASPLATQALIEALIQESSVTNLTFQQSVQIGGFPTDVRYGVLQFEAATATGIANGQAPPGAFPNFDPMVPADAITAFLNYHYSNVSGVNYGPKPLGAIATAVANPHFTADQIAAATQGAPLSQSHNYGQWASEAAAVIQAAGGGGPGGSSALALAARNPPSDVSQLTRGTPDNPDETSWTCMNRLASEVNWSLFSNGHNLYYADGPTLASQKPSAYIKLDETGTRWTVINPIDGDTAIDVVTNLKCTFDNTAFVYQETRRVKGRVVRKTGVRTPQTPSRVTFNMVCGILEYAAGDVFVFQNAGPLNGRWIVEDTTRNCLMDIYTQFTLGPPTLPGLEPAASNAGAALSGNTPSPTTPTNSGVVSPGTGTAAATAAQTALSQKQLYQYTESMTPGANGYTVRSNGGSLFGPAPRTMDCSAFVTLCYRAGGLSDPNHLNYAPPNLGNTDSLIAHCSSVPSGSEQLGDLCFYGPSASATQHVTIYVGGGQVISMGAPGDPSIGGAQVMGPAGFLGFWRPDVVSGSAASGITSPATAPNSPTSPFASSLPKLFSSSA